MPKPDRVNASELLAPVDAADALEAAARVLAREEAAVKRKYHNESAERGEGFYHLTLARLYTSIAQTHVRLARARDGF